MKFGSFNYKEHFCITKNCTRACVHTHLGTLLIIAREFVYVRKLMVTCGRTYVCEKMLGT